MSSDTPARVPLQEHQQDVHALLAHRATRRRVALEDLRPGVVIAADVRAVVDVPSADNSQMDGYAVRCADLTAAQPVTLPVGPPIAAGDAPGALEPGQARPIMTGAPVPTGADQVVPIEDTAEQDFTATTVTLQSGAAQAGRFVRRAGSDTRAGDVIAREGTALSAARIAHLAACGVASVEARDPLRVLVVSTGSELATPQPGAQLPRGAAFDANGPGIAAALRALGAEVVNVEQVGDDAPRLVDLIRRHAQAQAVVTSGGVSAGAFEPVRQAAELPGVRLVFPKVAMQPGGPQGIGTLDRDLADPAAGDIAWVALPGNPVSALLSVELLLRPALGATPRQRLRLPLQLDDPARPEPSPAHLEQYRRARVLPSGHVRLAGGPSSHLLGALAGATALVRVPVGVDALHDGDLVETILLPEGER